MTETDPLLDIQQQIALKAELLERTLITRFLEQHAKELRPKRPDCAELVERLVSSIHYSEHREVGHGY